MKLKNRLVLTLVGLTLTACQGRMSSYSSASTDSAGENSNGNSPAPTPNPNPGPNPLPMPSPAPSVTPAPRFSPAPGTWVNVTSNLSGLSSECGNMTHVSANPTEDMVIAGVAAQGLFASRDGGATWNRLGSGAGSDMITNRPSTIVYDPANPRVFYEAGIYNGRGVFRTDNTGNTFSALGNVGHNDGVSVDFTDPNRRTILAGGHEQRQTIYRSQDGGSTWTNVGGSLPAGSAFSSFPLVINSRVFLMGLNPSWGGGLAGIFQSNDSGSTWSQVSSQGGGSEPLVARDGSIYWPHGDGSLVRGTGSGSNWVWTQVAPRGTVALVHPVELRDGKIATLNGQRILLSADRGVTWQAVGPNLPFQPVGLTYSAFDHSIYIWYFDCGNKVLPNAIMKFWLP